MPIQLEKYLENTWAHKRDVNRDIKATILAAGLGSRMYPLTRHYLPKPMFPLAGTVPILETWVKRLVQCGITNISMNISVLGNTIKSYFKDDSQFGVDIQYVEEATPSGTLGAVCKQALGEKAIRVSEDELMPEIGEFTGTTIVAPSGDIVTTFDSASLEQMYEIHKQKGAAVTIILTPIPWEKRIECGTAELGCCEDLRGSISRSGKIVNFREKDPNSPSNLNNASIYMIEKDFLKTLDPMRTQAKLGMKEPFYDFGKHVFPAMLDQLKYITFGKDHILWGLQYDGLWFDVGRKEDYLSVNNAFMDGEIKIELPYESLPWGYLGSEVSIDFSKVDITPPVIIGNGCIIENGAKLGPYAVIGDGWTIEEGSHISKSVLWKAYPYITDEGEEVPVRERKLVDRHQVCKGATIKECIIVGGTIQGDLQKKTVDVLEDGRIEILPIDWVPEGPRA